MPKFFCDYCDVYLTHDSMSVRKAHNTGRNHMRNVIDYYQQIGHEAAQSVIDSITNSYNDAGQASSNPMLQHNSGAPGMMGAPPPFPPGPGAPFSLPPGMPPLPPNFPPMNGMPPFPPGSAGSPGQGNMPPFPPPGMPPGMPPNMPAMPPGMPPVMPPGMPPNMPPSMPPQFPPGMFPPTGQQQSPMPGPGFGNGPPGMPSMSPPLGMQGGGQQGR